jgi:hypothetical protein
MSSCIQVVDNCVYSSSDTLTVATPEKGNDYEEAKVGKGNICAANSGYQLHIILLTQSPFIQFAMN